MTTNTRSLLAFSLLAALSTPVLAQQADEASAGAQGGIEDIVVTAQRRSERLQDVPISVAAFTADALTKAGVQDPQSLTVATPGLVITRSRGALQPYIRGIGTQAAGLGQEASVAIYLDGVYTPALSGANLAFNNIERVEVLKGPQGTLFGRNATGGLIHVITRTPSHDPLLEGSIGYGNYKTWTANVYGTTGLSDTVAMDIAGYFTDQGKGWGRNLTLGNEVNYRKEWSIRSKLLFEPSDPLKITLSGDYNHINSDMGYARQIAPNTVGVGGLVFRGGYFDTQTNLPRLADLDQWGVSLKVDYDFGWSTLTSTTAYRSVRNFSNTDQDSGPLRFVDVQIDERTKTAQQEFLLHGDVGRLDWTAGVFLFRSKASVVPFQIRSGLIPAQNIDRFSEMRTNSVAGFAQGTYHLTDTTSLTAGLRYTSDERKIYGTQITGPGNPAGAGVVTGRRNPSIDPTAKKTFDKLTWRLSLDQKVNDDVLVYASYNRGFKSGIFNTAGPFDPVVAPETLDAYEVGVKSDLLDRHLRLNASAFHYIYKDIQLQVPVVGGSVALNAAKGRINGFDIDATASLPMSVGSFEVRTGFSYLDARYRDFPNAPFSVQSPAVCTPTPMQLPGARTGGSTTCIGNASGNRMIRSPKYTITVSADYTHPIGSGEGYLNLSYYYNGGFQWEIDNLHPEPSYDLVNGQIGFRPASRVWDVRFYARNILNKRYFQQFATSSLSDTVLAGEPRSYGVTLSFKLGK